MAGNQINHPCSAFGSHQNANPESSRRANPRLPTSWSGYLGSLPSYDPRLDKTKYHLPPTSQDLLNPVLYCDRDLVIFFFCIFFSFSFVLLYSAVISTLTCMRRCLSLDSGQLQALLLSDIDVRRGSITFFQPFIQQLPQQQKQIRIQSLHLFKS